MLEEIYLGCVPSSEECVQVDSRVDYLPEMRAELNRYKEYLEKCFPVPENIVCYFVIKWESHDFGRYGEVVIKYDEDDEQSIKFAENVDNNLPGNWNDVVVEGILFSKEDYEENKKRGMINLVIMEAKKQQNWEKL